MAMALALLAYYHPISWMQPNPRDAFALPAKRTGVNKDIRDDTMLSAVSDKRAARR